MQEHEIKSEMVMIRMSKQEKDALMELAKRYSMSLSDYMRFTGLNSKITIITNKNG